jgi:hypothetical protein
VVELGRQIVMSTSYQILPSRLLNPSSFAHPASTIEGKKAVLVSLGPSLDESEKQRKADVMSVEAFTRCKVQKSRTSKSSFEYKDIDINLVVSYTEYEKR